MHQGPLVRAEGVLGEDVHGPGLARFQAEERGFDRLENVAGTDDQGERAGFRHAVDDLARGQAGGVTDGNGVKQLNGRHGALSLADGGWWMNLAADYTEVVPV